MKGVRMAVYKNRCGGYKIKINNVDHLPPHCHAKIDGRQKQISLVDFEILNPPPSELPPALRKCLQRNQEEMLKAWDQVVIKPTGGL